VLTDLAHDPDSFRRQKAAMFRLARSLKRVPTLETACTLSAWREAAGDMVVFLRKTTMSPAALPRLLWLAQKLPGPKGRRHRRHGKCVPGIDHVPATARNTVMPAPSAIRDY
jgi:hypothetical protein